MNLHELLNAIEAGMKPEVGCFMTGGGAPGVDILTGSLVALSRNGIHPTHLSCTSAGAVAGLVYANTESPDILSATVRALKPDAVQSPTSLSWLPSWMQWVDCVALAKPLNHNTKAQALLTRYGAKQWEDIHIDLRMWSSILGVEGCIRHNLTCLDFDSPAQAALASMSVPYLLPPMMGRDPAEQHIDGGCTFNAPVLHEWIGTLDHCFLLVAQTRVADRPMPGNPSELDRAIHILRGMMAAQIITAVDQMNGHDNCTTVWPDFNDDTGLLTFNHDLIDKSDDFTCRVLKDLAPGNVIKSRTPSSP